MSKASKIINIFILIFAVAAVALGTLLFQKREEITQSRKSIAETVQKISSKIGDSKNKIQSDDLHISKKPADVKETMVKLEASVEKIVKQRDALTETLATVTNGVLEKAYIPEGDEAYLADAKVAASYSEYEEALQTIEKKVSERMQYIDTREQHLTDYMKKNGEALKLAARIYTTSPDNEKLSASFVEMNTKTKDVVARMNAFRSHIISATEKLSPNSPAPDLNLQEYPQLLAQNLTTVQDYVNAHNSLLKEVEELTDRVKRAESLIGTSEIETNKLRKLSDDAQKKVIELQSELKRLRQIIDPDGTDEEALARLNINFALLKNMVGKIVYVNEQFATFTINLGTESKVKDSNGKLNAIALPEHALLTVATSMDPETAQYVCKAQVSRVGANASTAVVTASPTGEITLPKVGDVVYFSTADINRMKEINAEALRQYNEKIASRTAIIETTDTGIMEDSSTDVGIDDGDFLNEADTDSVDDAIQEEI